MIKFFAHFLFILAAWTLTIKYVFPVAMAVSQGISPTTYVMLDFWWVIHIWLGWSLLRWPSYTYWLAVTTSVVEVIIVGSKFWLFLAEPQWDIWRTNWFINKIFVIFLFLWMLVYFVRHAKRLNVASGRDPVSVN